MKLKRNVLGWGIAVVLMLAGSANAKSGTGTLSGIVLDPSGTPQMGATVWLTAEDGTGRIISQLRTNQHGAFFSDLKPGEYSVRVSLAGFLPALERHIAVVADITTLLRVQIDSVFAALDHLRRNSDAPVDRDDWKWVLRSSAATRAVLQWRDGTVNTAGGVPVSDLPPAQPARGLVQMTSASANTRGPGNFQRTPATSFSYDQSLGGAGHLFLAGQVNYDRAASGGISTVWLPSGISGQGPETTFVARRYRIGHHRLMYQGVRLDHTEEVAVTSHVVLRAGAEYLHVGAGSTNSISAIRPHAQLEAEIAPNWTAKLIVAASPQDVYRNDVNRLQSAISELDSLPALLLRGGRATIENQWHQEVSVNHKLNDRASVEAAAFHEDFSHQGIFGVGQATTPDFFQNPLSRGFSYDAGGSNSWGTRLAYRQKIANNLEIAAVYSYAGTLSPGLNTDPLQSDLRDGFNTRYHHAAAARISGKLPRAHTQFAASYKWVSGTNLTRQDAFGDAAYLIDPNVHLSLRQRIPGMGGHWEAMGDFSNLLAQGYVPLATGPGSKILVIPVQRSIRGGLSFQF